MGTASKKQGRAKRKVALGGRVAQVYRDAILEAAERVFGRHGFEAAKMADIAAEAGLAAGTLYNYFESKVQIFQSLIDFRGEEMMETFRALSSKRCSSEERLLAIVQTYFEYLEKNRLMLRIFVQLGADSDWSICRVSPAAAERYTRFLDLIERSVMEAQRAKVLRKDVPAADLVALLSGSMNGYVHLWMRRGTKDRLGDAAERIVGLFLEGAKQQ